VKRTKKIASVCVVGDDNDYDGTKTLSPQLWKTTESRGGQRGQGALLPRGWGWRVSTSGGGLGRQRRGSRLDSDERLAQAAAKD
jgi:hypothetical protein